MLLKVSQQFNLKTLNKIKFSFMFIKCIKHKRHQKKKKRIILFENIHRSSNLLKLAFKKFVFIFMDYAKIKSCQEIIRVDGIWISSWGYLISGKVKYQWSLNLIQRIFFTIHLQNLWHISNVMGWQVIFLNSFS